MANFLGAGINDCYRLEYLTTKVDQIGKGFGSKIIKVIGLL